MGKRINMYSNDKKVKVVLEMSIDDIKEHLRGEFHTASDSVGFLSFYSKRGHNEKNCEKCRDWSMDKKLEECDEVEYIIKDLKVISILPL